ncbi:MAG: hypothetical protein LBG52_02480 [Candidatus Peribacteria bacterium]|jgi:hypothetical protein|nr:hypothetical protein [Candidatus Peribacteria bacterium]
MHLQTTFPTVYHKLFSEYEVVVSGHFGFNRFPSGIGHYADFVSIRQKLNAKCYLGIRKVSEIGISFEEVLMFNGEKFVSYPHESIHLYYQQMSGYLTEVFQLDKLGYGFRISCVAERSRGEGTGFTGVMSSLLSFGIGMFVIKEFLN